MRADEPALPEYPATPVRRYNARMRTSVDFVHKPRLRFAGLPTSVLHVLASLTIIGLLTALMLALEPVINAATAALLYILVVLLSAMAFGRHASLPSALLASLVFTFFFIPPYGAFALTSIENAVRLGVFLSVALLVSSLASQARRQAFCAQQRATELNALYQLSQALSTEVTLERILPIVSQMTPQILAVPGCQILLVDGNGNLPEAGNTAFEDFPLRAEERHLGVLRVPRPLPEAPLSEAERELLATIAAQVSLVLERVRLAEMAGQARALAESDRLKSTLLSLVSHDLRTPLSVIKGLATSLLDLSVAWTEAQRLELLRTINTETDRLNRLVSELLEMSRIEAGAIPRVRSLHALDELIVTVADRLRSAYPGVALRLSMPDELPWVKISYYQIEHVIRNLLENAITYAPSPSPFELVVSADAAQVRVEMRDRGPGIPPELRERVFEKFVRAAPAEQQAAGSGLGLAICKGLVEAHDGRIWVEARPGGGSIFAFTLPIAAGNVADAPPCRPDQRFVEADA